jgi:methionyl aminopeptidase
MSIDSDTDWRGLRTIGRIVRLTLDALERHVRPGVTTGELDRVAEKVVRDHGARSAPKAVYKFPGTVLISVNDEVVHGVPGARVIEPGDLVKLDVTLDKEGYVADAARTVLVGDASETATRLKACAEQAFSRGLDAARAGNLVRNIGRAIEEEVTGQGFTVIRQLGGHGVGRTIHEPPFVPNYEDHHQRDVLHEGLVLTIEPIICSGAARTIEGRDGWTIRTKDGSLSAHHEHTLVITSGRPVLLTAA